MTNTILHLNLSTTVDINVNLPEGKTSADISSMETHFDTVNIIFTDGTAFHYPNAIHEVEPDGEYYVRKWEDETYDCHHEFEEMEDSHFAQPIAVQPH